MRWRILLLLVIATSCSTPTHPTPVAGPVLRWDLTAAGCEPRLPVPVIGSEDQLVSETFTEGRTIWVLFYERPEDLLFVEFRLEGGLWKLCDWDTSDN